MVTSFKMSCARRATLNAPKPAVGQHRSTPLLETPGHSQASLGQSHVEALLLPPGFWSHSILFLYLQESQAETWVDSGLPWGQEH